MINPSISNQLYVQLFDTLGLSPLESQLYLQLLKLGPSSLSQLAKSVQIPRTTVHENIEKLIEKNLVSRTIEGKIKKVIAEKPSKLELLLDEQKVKLKTQQHDIKEAETKLPQIIDIMYQSIPNLEQNTDFEVKMYQGKEEIAKVYDEILKANEIMAYCDAKGIEALFPENFDKFTKAHNDNKKMVLREISTTPDNFDAIYVSKLAKDRYYYKVAPDNLKLTLSIDYLIFDQKVALINLIDPPTCIIINNYFYYQNAKSLFEFIWQMIPSLQVKVYE